MMDSATLADGGLLKGCPSLVCPMPNRWFFRLRRAHIRARPCRYGNAVQSVPASSATQADAVTHSWSVLHWPSASHSWARLQLHRKAPDSHPSAPDDSTHAGCSPVASGSSGAEPQASTCAAPTSPAQSCWRMLESWTRCSSMSRSFAAPAGHRGKRRPLLVTRCDADRAICRAALGRACFRAAAEHPTRIGARLRR
jgi:hypothetical protein